MAKLTTLTDRFGALPAENCVPDLLAPNLDIVFCGTALGYQSAQAKAYYANPGNFFWRTLHAIGLTPTALRAEEYAKALNDGIGLTDLCKTAYGQDSQLPKDAFDATGLEAKMLQYQPRFLAFTSKTAASAFLGRPTAHIQYGLQPQTIGRTRIYVLPSPSGQARIFWDIGPWQALADQSRTPTA